MRIFQPQRPVPFYGADIVILTVPVQNIKRQDFTGAIFQRAAGERTDILAGARTFIEEQFSLIFLVGIGYQVAVFVAGAERAHMFLQFFH